MTHCIHSQSPSLSACVRRARRRPLPNSAYRSSIVVRLLGGGESNATTVEERVASMVDDFGINHTATHALPL